MRGIPAAIAFLWAVGPAAAADGLADYQEGKILFERAEYRAAIERFERSFATSRRAVNLYNLAECWRHLGDAERAVESYRRYVEAPDATEDLRARARARIAELLALPARVRVASDPPGADLRVDGEARARGATPVEIDLPAGAHRLTLRLPGHDDATAEVSSAFGRPVDVRLRLQPRPVAPAISPQPAAHAARAAPSPAPPQRAFRLGLLAGPAIQRYGDPSLDAGTTTEFGLLGGFDIDLSSRLRADVTLLALAAPARYVAPDDRRVAWFFSLIAQPGIALRRGALSFRLGLGLGATWLAGADADAPFFRDAFEADGPFAALVVRPEVSLGVDLTSRLVLSLTLFALDWSPAFDEFRGSGIEHVARFHFATGIALRL